MKCYECGDEALAICRWCGVALCRKDLARSIDARGSAPACAHRMPAPGNAERPGDTVEVPTLRSAG